MKSNLKQIRQSKGLSQFELSIQSHTPQSLISMLEHDRMKPWPKVIERLSNALQVPPEQLFDEGVEPCTTSR